MSTSYVNFSYELSNNQSDNIHKKKSCTCKSYIHTVNLLRPYVHLWHFEKIAFKLEF